VEKAQRRTEVRREPFLPTTQIHGLCSRSQSKEVLGWVLTLSIVERFAGFGGSAVDGNSMTIRLNNHIQ